ncbi:hypothetical protein [Paenibacillus sp. Cedars]|uniref:hypothetical protein n=1 Tax=Paenibacillus sp. Cedars TaxID=1980674 RepID=UPI001163ACB8|nr:hypothetical protein [Paenibacillus sp. Cedars]AWP28484.1 hypothetical protein B9D94_18475 [Paenibacillus sp. Cedars]
MERWRMEFERVWGNGQADELDSLAVDDRFPQIKYHLIDSVDWYGEIIDYADDLFDKAFERLHTVFTDVGPFNDTRVNAIYTNPLVQVIVSRAIERLATLYWYTRPSRDDLYQESFIIARKMTKSYYRKHSQTEVIAYNYLGYLRKYLYLKLKRYYFTN